MYRHIGILLVFFTALFVVSESSAQLAFGNGGGRGAVLMSTSNYGDNIENRGIAASRPFTVQVWASTDNVFEASEVISNGDYGALAAGESLRHNFSYSIPLKGDTRPLSEIVGSPVFFQICFDESGAAPVCRTRSLSVVSPDPPTFQASKGDSQDGVNLTFTVPTVNSELPFEFLRVTRIDRIADAGPINPPVELFINANEVTVLADTGSELTLQALVDTADTSIAEFTLQQCYSAVIGAFQCGATAFVSQERGYRQAVASSVSGEFNDRIRVQWPNFVVNQAFEAYQVTRCEVENPSVCVSNKVRSTALGVGDIESFDDLTAERGVSYIYTIDACEGLNPNACVVQDNLNIARSGPTSVGLIDQFENDDSPAQATVVFESVSQVRSLHTSTDEDWVRVEVAQDVLLTVSTSAVRNQNVDTVLELYKSTQSGIELIESNDDVSSDQVASFSIIGPVALNAGVYFVKASHFQLIPDGGGDPIIPAPIVPNYRLNVTLEAPSRSAIIMVPILDLLLSD